MKMNVHFVDSYPYRVIKPDLQALGSRARRIDAAIAFVTAPGVAMLREYLKARPPGTARLIASVRFPTNLTELAYLEEDYPGTVFLHTGFQTPVEEGAERGQFHSKVLLLELDGTQRCVVLGSHNWTANALEGHNMEAGIILRCQESDPIVAEVREHIDACARRSEPFSPERLTFYRTVQWDLHRRIGPTPAESESFPGFERMGALVMHAEDHCLSTTAGSGGSAAPELPDPLQLFVPVSDAPTGDLFPTGRRVLLYLYPAGSLLGKSPPTAPPVAYEGSVTMSNVVRDASAEGRPATCCIDDLAAPRINLLPAAVVPKPAGEILQVVIRLDEHGRGPLPIFHAARQAPRLKLGIDYVTVDRDEPHEPRAAERTAAPTTRTLGGPGPIPEYRAPRYLTLEATVNVPSPHLYTYPIEPLLNHVLLTSELSDQHTLPDITITQPASTRALNTYVYQVEHWLSKETMHQVQTQMKLF